MPATHIAALIARETVGGAVDSAKNSCFSKSYCKWPVIAAIIVGALIILSLLFCCIRCLCCGAECCCGCLSCCNECCPSPRNRGHKPLQNDYGPPPNPVNPNSRPYQQQYQSHPPPVYNSGPQYAQFDANPNKGAYAKPGNPDSLPSMPTWDNAPETKVETFDHEDNVEMNDLDHHGQEAPMMGGAATAGSLRPGMNSRNGSGHMSPGTERESYLSTGSGSGHYQSANDLSGYGGAATGGYRGAAPQPSPIHSPYGTTAHTSPTRQQFAPNPPQQQGYAAYNPNASSTGSNTPAYPGQRTYQRAQSPTSRTNFSGSTLEPSLEYPEQYRPQQELRDPESHVEGWDGGVGRKPVGGSWRDV